MKKLWILLVALSVFAAAPIFAQESEPFDREMLESMIPVFGGEFMAFGHTDFDTIQGYDFPKVELNMHAPLGDYADFDIELDSEVTGPFDPSVVAIDDLRVEVHLSEAFMLPIDAPVTGGSFDLYFTGWSYYDASGWTWYYDWPNKLLQYGPDANGALHLDLGYGPVTFHWYNDFAGEDFMVALDAAFGGFSAWLGYGNTTFDAFGDGDLSIEAAYGTAFGDFALDAGAFFRYGLGDSAFTYGLNLGAGYGMFHLGAGFEGDDVDALDNMVAELKVTPTDAAGLAVAAFFNLASTNGFTALDISGYYEVSTVKFIVGYVVGGQDKTGVPVVFSGDNYAVPNGLYAGVDVDF
jgi:hypothetical protein